MKAKLRLVFSISIFFACFSLSGQEAYWKSAPVKKDYRSASLENMEKAKGVYTLEQARLFDALTTPSRLTTNQHIVLPLETGEFMTFEVHETPVLHKTLAAKYPAIKSYTGISQNGKYKLKLSRSSKGIDGMLVNLENQQTSFIEKVKGVENTYTIFEKSSGHESKNGFVCKTADIQKTVAKTITPLVDDQMLRKFRIAVSTSGEYTDYHGGTVADALAAINTTLTRINEVFETDFGVTLELIPNNDQIIFTNANTDPYNGNLNSEVQTVLTSTIGEENYDVGHLFHKVDEGQDNGNAGFIGSVCVDNSKGSAFSAAFIPEGDVFDLDFVSHELGHQFGANHTWSFESEGTGVQAEPASGTTIMGYAGIVPGNNVTPTGSDYFHFYSIQQVSTYLQTVSCAEETGLTNNPPVLTPVGDFVIPKGTAFVLEGIATDPDAGDVLTYTWEQIDDGVVTTATFGPENPSGANFRSLPPSTSPMRYFPNLSRVVQGELTEIEPETNGDWETVSNVSRNFEFAFVVRDNADGGGQVVSDVLDVQVVSAGPFTVTSQATSAIYDAGSIQQITWDVAGTNILPIDAKTVDIFLSVDGGNTFPLKLAEDVLNDGEAEVQLPGMASTQARIMVKASDNIFFAVNSSDFTIQETSVVLDFQDLEFEVCQPDNLVIPFTYNTFGGFNENSTFSVDLPVGLNGVFAPTQASTDATAVQLTISNTNSVAPGAYEITVTSTSASETVMVPLNVIVKDNTFSDVVLQTPLDSEGSVSVNTQLLWEVNVQYDQYDVEVATDAGFATIVESATVPFNFYQTTSLAPQTEYFWRVRPTNSCGAGTFGTPFSFTTIQVDCKEVTPAGLPLDISAVGTSTITRSVQILEDLPVNDINVTLEINHSYTADLIVSLTSPAGTRVTLISNTCGEANNINAVFDDAGIPIACSNDPAISGAVQPLGLLSAFNGESALGEWTLEIQDTATGDGGALVDFSLEVCAEGVFRPDADEDGVFDDGDDLCLGTPKGVEVDTTGCPINRFPSDNFTVEIQSESCRSSNDGSITISALDESITYTAVLSGATTATVDFTNTHAFQNLQAGNYSVCITGTDGMINYAETCFDIVLSEPQLLSVFTNLVGSNAELTLQGGTIYSIELNGLVTQTTDEAIVLELKEGRNSLIVTTGLECQGTFEESYLIATRPILYPNAVSQNANVYLNGYSGNAQVRVFSSIGQLVLTQNAQLNGNDLEVDVSSLPRGTYYMQVNTDDKQEVIKMIKQ
ncbi:M12 family metallo-peptidase [Muricauda sp. 2012CJ35-5]|uniref:M12 family metallo-peptidase n=1 Tax=Flagellimonas spongiicola TaxID=2942208 RepID=A0ABT0PUE2_9FLAO|nr:zinc-dependent metalloprotease family protein [Allomuricauda spongiicola]MCL6274616.1 M12 family metallo-peptidase [Allomuricauda spongiicola]